MASAPPNLRWRARGLCQVPQAVATHPDGYKQANVPETTVPLVASVPTKVPDLSALTVHCGYRVTSQVTPLRAPEKPGRAGPETQGRSTHQSFGSPPTTLSPPLPRSLQSTPANPAACGPTVTASVPGSIPTTAGPIGSLWTGFKGDGLGAGVRPMTAADGAAELESALCP